MEELGTVFLGAQVDKLQKFIDGENPLDKEEVHMCLKTISSFIIGKR